MIKKIFEDLKEMGIDIKFRVIEIVVKVVHDGGNVMKKKKQNFILFYCAKVCILRSAGRMYGSITSTEISLSEVKFFFNQ